MALLFQLTQKLAHGFQGFWDRYPLRKAKQDAEKAWKQRVTPEIEAQIHQALDWQIPEWEAMDWYTPPLPATYIRKERYTDQPTKKKSPTPNRPTANVRPMTPAVQQQQDAMSRIRVLMDHGMSREDATRKVSLEMGWIKG